MFDVLSTERVLTVPVTTPEPAAARPQLGQVLLERGLLSEEQLDAGLAQQRWTGRPLGEVLIALGFVTEATIAQALATQPEAPADSGPPISPPGMPARPSSTSWREVAVVPAQPPTVSLHQLEVAPTPVPLAKPGPALAETFEERARAAALEARIEELEEQLRDAHRRAQTADARMVTLEADSGSASVRHEALELELAGARLAEADLRVENQRQARELAEATLTLQAAFARLQYLEALVQQQPEPATAQTRSPYAWQD
jgi:hypothetical protein